MKSVSCAGIKLGHSRSGKRYIYLSMGVEGRRILNCKNPHILIDTLSTAELWNIVKAAFILPWNITFDHHVLLITKRLQGETVQHFYGKLKELAKKCDLDNKEVILIRNVYITNLIDPEIQKELLKQKQSQDKRLNWQLMWNSGCKTDSKYNYTIRPSSPPA